MTADPVRVGIGTSVSDVARLMRDHGIGGVLVVDGETLVGIVTDRDIAVRAVAAGLDPMDSTAGEIYTTHPFTVPSSCPLVSAVEQMRSAAVRRVPVVDEGRLVGIVSLGDLARSLDGGSALAQISDTPWSDWSDRA